MTKINKKVKRNLTLQPSHALKLELASVYSKKSQSEIVENLIDTGISEHQLRNILRKLK